MLNHDFQAAFGRTIAWAAMILLGACACRKQPSEPDDPIEPGTATPPVLLSVGSPSGDEDPSLLRAANGTVYAAWFSNRGTSADIYIASTTDRATWSTPVQVSREPHGDFYPNLIQDSQQRLHLTWFAWVAPFLGQIRHSSSLDGVTWSDADAVTTEFLLDDWVPTMAEGPNGSLLVYFVAAKRNLALGNNQIYLAVRRPGQAAWDPPVPLSINSPTEHDHLPFVARTGPGQFTMVWVRFAGDADFITNPRSDLFTATSSDGLTWSAPVRVTSDQRGQNLFPQIYQRHDGSWFLLWLSTRTGSPTMYEMPVSGLASFPAGLTVNALLPAGYSHRLTTTPKPGEYLAAWVQGGKGVEDVYYRLITR